MFIALARSVWLMPFFWRSSLIRSLTNLYSFLSLLIFAVCHGIFEMCVYTVGKKCGWSVRESDSYHTTDGLPQKQLSCAETPQNPPHTM
nr:MAG TPA: hypothetical protein [Caudoviricetes sp.]